jgi:hypothetical protein
MGPAVLSMPETAAVPPPTHREVTPVQTCMACGCYLRTGNERTTCDPCGIPDWEKLDEELWERLPDLHLSRRRAAFEALEDIETLMAEV